MGTSPRKPLRIAIVLPAYHLATNDMVQGITRFGRATRRFEFRDLPFVVPEDIPPQLSRFQPDGMILWLAVNGYEKIREQIPTDLPLVKVGAPLPRKNTATIRNNDAELVRLAVDHLRASYAQLAFVGSRHHELTERRYKEFAKIVSGGGFYASPLSEKIYRVDPVSEPELEQWMVKMKRPLGVVALHGHIALQLVDACRNLNWKIPHDLGLISLFDDRWCLTAEGGITAVRGKNEQLGFEAMAALAEILQGRSKKNQLILVSPRDVVQRGSAEPDHLNSDHMERAVKFIEEHAHQGIQVQDVIRVTQTVSRRTFYNDFLARMNCSPGDYICRVKIDRARQLLTETQLPIKRVASMCGFRSAARFGEMFRNVVGQTPLAYRKRTRSTPASKGIDKAARVASARRRRQRSSRPPDPK